MGKRYASLAAVLALAAGLMALIAPAAHASTCAASTSNGSCGPYAYQPQITSAGGGDTYVNNNVWNPPPGFTGQTCTPGSATPCETTTATDPGHWSTTANFTSQGGAVQSYPDTQQLYGSTVVDSYSSLTSSFTEALSGADAATMEEAAYDIFLNNWASEVMIWVDTTPAQAQTLSFDTNLGTFTIAGQSWTVYRNGGVGAETIFSLNSNEQTGTVDLKAMLSFLESKSWETPGSTLSTIDFGPEFASTDGQFATYTQSCFTISENVASQPCGTQQAQPPAVVTNAASGVSSGAATLNGTVNPEGQATTWQYQYGTTTSYGSVIPASPASAGPGASAVSEPQPVTGLSPNTTYHYRLTAANASGTTNGSDQQFTTPVATSLLVGNNTVLSTDSNVQGQAQAYSYTAAKTGTSQTFSFYVDSSSTTTTGVLGVYTDSGGNPGRLLGQLSFTPAAGRWNTVAFTGVSITSGTKYWLAELGANGILAFRDKGTGAYSPGSSQTNLTSLPSVWTTGPQWYSGPMSAYVSG